MSTVRFYNADKKLLVKNKKLLSAFISFLFSNENKNLDSLSVISCSDEYLLTLNKQFLNHDYYTDILTFDLSNKKNIIGEIYISLDRVKENRLLHQASFHYEFYRIVFHGALHLCGYFDKTSEEKMRMTELENFYLEEYTMFHVKQI